MGPRPSQHYRLGQQHHERRRGNLQYLAFSANRPVHQRQHVHHQRYANGGLKQHDLHGHGGHQRCDLPNNGMALQPQPSTHAERRRCGSHHRCSNDQHHLPVQCQCGERLRRRLSHQFSRGTEHGWRTLSHMRHRGQWQRGVLGRQCLWPTRCWHNQRSFNTDPHRLSWCRTYSSSSGDWRLLHLCDVGQR